MSNSSIAAAPSKRAYHFRNVEDERTRLIRTHPDALDVLNHYGFAGEKDFSQGFRVLVIDEGSGDAAIFLAEQLRAIPACEVVYLSSSTRAIEQVRGRGSVRGLSNLRVIEGMLDAVKHQNVKPFDYISCNVPLQEMNQPSIALTSLADALSDDGVLLVRFDGKYGNMIANQIRELITQIDGESALEEKLSDLKKLLPTLPETNWYKRTADQFAAEIGAYGDEALLRLFMEGEKTCYSVSEIYELVEAQGLHLLDFVTQEGDARVRYAPETVLTSPKTRAYLDKLDVKSRQAIAEITCGTLTSHYCYTSKRPKPRLSLKDKHLVPFYTAEFIFPNIGNVLSAEFESKPQLVFTHNKTGYALAIESSPYAKALSQAIDGKMSIEEIIAKVLSSQPELSEEMIFAEFTRFYNSFNRYDWMLLRAKHVPDFPSTAVMQQRCF